MDETKLEGTVSASDVAAQLLYWLRHYCIGKRSLDYHRWCHWLNVRADYVSARKLHTMLYCVQGIHLLRNSGRPFFFEKIKAGRYGPVVVSDHPLLQDPDTSE